jgi:hypothetical protein
MAKTIKAKTVNGSDGRALTTAERYDFANELDLYEFTPPAGEWIGKLNAKSWGKSMSVICYFEDVSTGALHRLTAFRSRNNPSIYTPRDGNVDFSEAGIEGRIYILNSGLSSKETPCWHSASQVLND